MDHNESSPDLKGEQGSTPTPAQDSTPSSTPYISKLEIEALNGAVLPRVFELLPHFSVEGRLDGNEWLSLNPRREDKNLGSFKFNTTTGYWADFAAGSKAKKHRGHGLVSYVAHNKDIPISEAANLVAAALASLGPVEASVSTASTAGSDFDAGWGYQPTHTLPTEGNLNFPGLGTPTVTYTYHEADGRIALIVARWNLPDGSKEIRPLTPWVDSNGASRWRWKQAPKTAQFWKDENAPKSCPLYNLLELMKRPQAAVLVVEGEKTADAAKHLLPEYVVVTWAGGASSTSFTDWLPLAKRDVVIWPDHDPAGSAAALSIRSWLEGRNTEVRTLSDSEITGARQRVLSRTNPAGSSSTGSELPDGYDAADAVAEGWIAEDFFGIINIASLPRGFYESDGYIYKETGGDEEHGVSIKVCGHLEIMAKVRDEQNGAWGRLVRWTDSEGVEHNWCLPMQILGSDSGDLANRFLDGGLYVSTDRTARSWLHELIQISVATRLLRCVSKVGWHGSVYVLGDKGGTAIRPDGHSEGIVLQTTAPLKPAKIAGSVEGWRRDIAARCLGNSRLIFGVSVAFAAPLMHLVQGESGGYHLVGSSSTGKTTAVQVASSVFGNQPETWRTTDNALEAVAARHNDGVLILDEISECPAERIGAVAYMLANGTGKSRMNKTLTTREPMTWRVLVLSTGEVGLADHLRSVHRDVRAGQEVRFADLPADAGAGLGCFENLHGETNGHLFAERLKHAVREHSGTAGPALMREVVRDQTEAIKFVKQAKAEFTTRVVPIRADGQVHRVAERFALVAAAGELASATGITGWPSGTAMTAVETCFKAWLAQRAGGSGSTEEAQILERIRRVLLKEGAAAFESLRAAIPGSAFSTIPEPEQRIQNRLGWWRHSATGGREYLFTAESWKQIFQGLDPKLATSTLRRLGFLVPDNSGKGQQAVLVPNLNTRMRLYVVSAAVLGDEGADAVTP